MPTTREKIEAARRAYDTAGKNKARAVVMGVAAATKPMTVLDLWGGGESARAFQQVVPDATVVSAERDEDLWPLLLADAQSHGFTYHFGPAQNAPGRYDLVWLDLCAQASKDTEAAIAGVSAKLTVGGSLFVTIMPARETDRVLAGAQRLLQLPLWLEAVSKLKVRFLMPYRRDNGLPMWLVALRSGDVSHFHDETRFSAVKQAVADREYWNDGLPISEDALYLLSMRGAQNVGGVPDLHHLADIEASRERGVDLQRATAVEHSSTDRCHGCGIRYPEQSDVPPWHVDWQALHHEDCNHKGCTPGHCAIDRPGVVRLDRLGRVEREIIEALINLSKSARKEAMEADWG